MALVVPPPRDRKRVKVYELRNNDWFDRGTGFCMGRVAGVSETYSEWIVAEHGQHSARYAVSSTDSYTTRRSQESTSNPKTNRSVCYLKPEYRKMMATRSSKVCISCKCYEADAESL